MPDEAGSSNFETMTAGEVMAFVEEALAHLGVENLTRVLQLADERRKERQDEAKEVLLREFRDRAAEMGMSLDNLFPAKGRKRRADAGGSLPVKYRHPDDPTLTWSGRGKPPRWIVQAENAGTQREEFRV